MRLVVATCTVDYDGRLTAHLPAATRLIMVKADGCVAIHADGGAYKPLNWMNAPNILAEGEDAWVVSNPKGESLTITLHEVHSDQRIDLGIDPGLVKDGVEAHLQELLALEPGRLGEGVRLLRREFPTEIGPVDLLCRGADGTVLAVEVDGRRAGDGALAADVYLAVEIKRKATIQAVEQLSRYLECIALDGPVRGILAATDIAPQARTLAERRGIRCVVLDYEELKGIERAQQSLF